MGLDAHILAITEPTIKLEDVKALDMGQSEGGDNFDSFQGGAVPLVKINGYVFQQDEVISLNLKLVGKYPELTASLKDSQGVFTVAQFPRDGDILSLRIKVDSNGTYKDIRMDFHILEFRAPATTSDKAVGENTFNLRAIAKLPGLYSEECKSYGRATSYDHLIQISRDLQLGFATNISQTNDEMVRLCAYQSKLSLLDETVTHSYVSDDSFQTYCIDPYYYVNFVDLQKVFNATEEVELDEFISATRFDERKTDSDEGSGKNVAELLLTNNHNMGGSATHFDKYSLVNNSTRIALENGYKRTLQYFDLNEEGGKLLEFTTESLVSSTIKGNEEALKGASTSKNDEYQTHVKHKYIGLQHSSDNVHLNWSYGFINNHQNLVELEKMKLVIELDTTNPAIYRYMKIPVMIYNYARTADAATREENALKKENGFENQSEKQLADRNETTTEENTYDSAFTLDEFLSAYYVVMGIEYTFSQGSMKQKLHLSRREWPVRQAVINKIVQ